MVQVSPGPGKSTLCLVLVWAYVCVHCYFLLPTPENTYPVYAQSMWVLSAKVKQKSQYVYLQLQVIKTVVSAIS